VRHYKFPKWLKRFYPRAIWNFSSRASGKKIIYLTFDDGPHPNTTPWLLDLLKQYQAHATFFCLGKNAAEYPKLFDRLTAEGHTVGNHSQSHPNGLKVNTDEYVKDIINAERSIKSHIFRPPYGKITPGQHRKLKKLGYRVIFWSHITYDFDQKLPSNVRMEKIKSATKPGAVIVFHDSEKALPQLKVELPQLLEHWKKLGYRFATI